MGPGVRFGCQCESKEGKRGEECTEVSNTRDEGDNNLPTGEGPAGGDGNSCGQVGRRPGVHTGVISP